jgi:hypothetical protein
VLISNATPGVNHFLIGGYEISVNLPKEGAGARGIFFGDPCTEPGFVGCIHFNNSNMSARLPRLVNSLADLDFRTTLGDNFYDDQDGAITKRFFEKLTTQAMAQWQLTVPGNHDFWTAGSPLVATHTDQFGNGFVQYYGIDSYSGKTNTTNFIDFSSPPTSLNAARNPLPAASNFFFYHVLGNVGFVGFSGAHVYEDYELHFEESCNYFDKASPRPAVIFLLGHWSTSGLGCERECIKRYTSSSYTMHT